MTAYSKYKRGTGGYNNYLIFKNVFYNTLQERNIFSQYPDLFFDSNHYGVFFSLLIAPFAMMPDGFGAVLWNVAGTLVFLYAIYKLPIFRISLFWLSFHNFPLWIYKFLSKLSLNATGFLNIYFHPWEFADISNPKYKLPNFTFKNTNEAMINRFDDFIKWAKKNNYQFSTTKEFLENWTQKNKN